VVLIILVWIVYGIHQYVHVNGLVNTLTNGSKDARVSAAKELIERDKLFEQVQAMPATQRIKVIDVLERAPGDATVKQLITLLKDSDIKTRSTALLADATLDVSSLLFQKESDSSKHTLYELKKSQAEVKNQQKILDDETKNHAEVTKILGILGRDHIDTLIQATKDPDPNVSAGVQDALFAIGAKAVPQLAEAVKAVDLRPFACAVLIRIKDPSVDSCIKLLKDKDQDVRMSAADNLGKIGNKLATPALLDAAHDTQAVRRVAVSSLCSLCDARSGDVLVDVLRHNSDDGEVRARSARALSVIGGQNAVTALIGALGDLDLKVRTSVVNGLQTIGAPAVKPIVSAMAGGSRDVRESGANALSGINSADAIPVLVQLARDADPVVREAAARGLGIQTATKMDALIAMLSDPDGRVTGAVADAFADQGARGVPSLVGLLQSGAGDVAKYRACEALSKIGSPAVSPLLTVLNKGGDVTKWAAYALGRSGDTRGKTALAKLASTSDPDLAWVVQGALHRM
jgi:HEAT repeat protein